MSLFDWFRKRRRKRASDPLEALTTAGHVEAWRRIILGDHKSWVLFRHGTCVILAEPEADLRSQAIALLREWGPVRVGSPAGDFSTVKLTEYPGWVVTCHHHDIFTYVSPEEIYFDQQNDLAVGLLGRGKRDEDSTVLEIIHVEDNHNVA